MATVVAAPVVLVGAAIVAGAAALGWLARRFF